MITDLVHRLSHDGAWLRLTAAVLYIVGLAFVILSLTAWSARHD